MSSVNKVILVGNCGRDPEVRYMPSGSAVANISIATSSRRKDRNTGQVIEETQWHRVTFFERLAEVAGEYLKKGGSVYIEGRLKYGTFIDKTTGVEKNTVDIIATEMQLLGSRQDQGAQPQRQQPERQQPERGQESGQQNQQPKHSSGGFDDMDGDIPF